MTPGLSSLRRDRRQKMAGTEQRMCSRVPLARSQIINMTTMLDIDERRPGAKLLMAPAARIKGLLAEHASEAEGLLSVTMLCCGESAHAEASRFTEFLGEKLGPEIDFQVRHWTF